MKKFAVLCLWFVFIALSACSTSQQKAGGENLEFYAKLSETEADAQLTQLNRDVEELDKEIRGAEIRRDNAQLKQQSDPSKDAAYEGAEAELDSLRMRKGTLINRQLLLERRLRELRGPAY
jgi:hypothetical protein